VKEGSVRRRKKKKTKSDKKRKRWQNICIDVHKDGSLTYCGRWHFCVLHRMTANMSPQMTPNGLQ